MRTRALRGISAQTGALTRKRGKLELRSHADAEPLTSSADNIPNTPSLLSRISFLPELIRSAVMRHFRGGRLWSPISDTLSLLNISRINVRHNSMSVIGRLARRYQFGFILRFSRRERASVYYYCFAFMAAEWADSDRFRCGNSMGACMRERESHSRERLGRLCKCTRMRMCRECMVKKPDFPARRFLQAAHTCFQFLSR